MKNIMKKFFKPDPEDPPLTDGRFTVFVVSDEGVNRRLIKAESPKEAIQIFRRSIPLNIQTGKIQAFLADNYLREPQPLRVENYSE